jgi:hypothetical protein
MSYRNPGNIPIADPSAFINAFNQGIEKYKKYYEEKAEKKKKELAQIDASIASFNKQMDYPELVKQYGPRKVQAIKDYVNENYLSTSAFANAPQSEKQDILDDVRINLIGKMQKTEGAASIDPTDMDMSVFDSTPEFKDFLLNRANGYAFSIKEGNIGYEYKDSSGQSKFISSDEIPDKIPELKTKTQVYTDINTKIEGIAKKLDNSHKLDDSTKTFDTGLSNELSRLFAGLTDMEKSAYWEKAQVVSGVAEEEALSYKDFPENMTDEEIKKAVDNQEKAIMALLKQEIRSNSTVYNKFETEIKETKEEEPEQEKAKDIQTRKSNDYIVKTPITDEQWNSVIKTDGNKSMASMSNLVSSYGFSLVGSPIASESGESEIGYNIKDNITNKTIKIFKSDTPQQVRKKMADLRGIDIYSSFVTQ